MINFFIIFFVLFAIVTVMIKFWVDPAKDDPLFWTHYVEVVVVLFLFCFYIVKKMCDKIEADVNALTLYLEALNDKDYNAHIKIRHNLEFLKISLLLKNLVKRLQQKK